jgi:uncharacterized protein (TIGR02246 family)
MRTALVSVVMLLAVVTACGNPTPRHDAAADRAAIEAALRQWPHDFNDRKLSAVCGLFADDVVLAYPQSRDRDHRAFCDQMQTLFADPARRPTYAEPEISEILVDGDLAAVRLIWPLTVTDATGKTLETTREDGLDVFQRQPDGAWKIRISHAFP